MHINNAAKVQIFCEICNNGRIFESKLFAICEIGNVSSLLSRNEVIPCSFKGNIRVVTEWYRNYDGET